MEVFHDLRNLTPQGVTSTFKCVPMPAIRDFSTFSNDAMLSETILIDTCLTIELDVYFQRVSEDMPIFTTRQNGDKGIWIALVDGGCIEASVNDGCSEYLLKTGRLIADGDHSVITVTIGGEARCISIAVNGVPWRQTCEIGRYFSSCSGADVAAVGGRNIEAYSVKISET